MLRDLRERRSVSFRKGKEIRVSRSENIEAILGFTVGQKPEKPCKGCSAGCGIFDRCVVVPGFSKGSCASCHYIPPKNW